jgi:hypothetical protein
MFEQLFTFGKDMREFLDTLTASATQRSAAAKERAAVAAKEMGVVADSATQYNAEAKNTLDRLQTIQAQEQEARRLAESNNIIDRITLIGEQVINPRAYTNQGRTQQMSEASQQLALRGQIHNVQIAESEARIQQARAQEELATAGTDAAMAALRIQVDGMALRNEAWRQTETLRLTNLSQLDTDTLQQALIGPPDESGRKVIGGMPYTDTELQERLNALKTREQLAILSPQATNPEFASALRNYHDLQLGTFTIPELEQLRQNDYIMQDGTQVEPAVWDQHWQRANILQQQQLEKAINEDTLQNQVPVLLQDSMKTINTLQSQVVPGTPLGGAFAEYQVAVGSVAQLAGADTTPQGRIIQLQRLQQARDKLYKAVDEEAKRRAAGDSDLASIYKDQMLGVPLSPVKVQDMLVSRYVGRKGFGEILPNQVSARIQRTADQTLTRLMQENAYADISGAGFKRSEKDLREEAIRLALEREAAEVGVNGMNRIQLIATQRQDHPAVKAGMVPGQLTQLQARATELAKNTVMQEEKLEPAQMQAIMQGNWQDAGIDQQRAMSIASRINFESTFQEYALLEQQKEGLGYEVVQWYGQNLPEFAKNYTATQLTPTEQALASDSILNAALQFNSTWVAVDEAWSSRGDQIAIEMATGVRKPENMWPLLVQTSERLADSQKEMVYYNVIDPLIQSARAMGFSDEKTMEHVLNGIRTFASEDKILTQAVNGFSRALPKQIDDFDTTWKWAMSNQHRTSGRGLYSVVKPEQRIKQIIPWIRDPQGGKGTN